MNKSFMEWVELIEWVELMHKHIMLHSLFLTSENMDCAEADTEQDQLSL